MHTCQIHVCRSGFLRWPPAGLCVSRMITIEHLLSAIQSLLKTYCCSHVSLGTIFVFWVWSTLYHFKLDFWIRSAIMHACVLQYLQEMPMQQIQVNTARTAEVHDRKLTLQPDNISILSGPLKLYRAARHQQSSFVMTCQMVPANGCQHTACVPWGASISYASIHHRSAYVAAVGVSRSTSSFSTQSAGNQVGSQL